MADLTASGIELGLKVFGRGASGARHGPSLGWGEKLAPGIESAFTQPKFLGNHSSGLAATQPVPDSLQFEGGVELAPGFEGSSFDDGFHSS